MKLLQNKRAQLALVAAVVGAVGVLFPQVAGPVSALAAALVQAIGGAP